MTEFLDVPGGRIAYDVAGEGPLVVAAPGMGDVRGAYRLLVPELVAAGYRVATMDLRGHGESSTGWPSHTTTAHGADYAALVRHLGGGPATVVGHSFSPDAAVTAAAELPEGISGLVAIAPWPAAPQPGPATAALTKLVVRTPLLWGMFYRSLHKGPKPADLADHVRGIRAMLREPGRTAAFTQVAAGEAKDSAHLRERVRQPALVVMGAEDPDFDDPRVAAGEFAAGLGGETRIVMVEDAGHYPHTEQPAATVKAVLEFLGETARA